MSLQEIVHARREDILHTASQYGAYNVRVFSSLIGGSRTVCKYRALKRQDILNHL